MSDTAPPLVLRIITNLYISGPTLQSVLLTSRLNQLGYEGILLGGKPSERLGSMSDMAREYGIEVIEVDVLDRTINPLTLWRSFWKLYRIIKERKPDVVHTHTTTAGFLGRLAAKFAGVPVIVHTMHFHPFHGYYNRFRTQAFILVERIGAMLSDSIITLSQSLLREITDTYHITNRNRFTVLPIGLDLQPFAETKRHSGEFRAKFNIPADVPLVGIIGRLIPVKNMGLFLSAAHEIHQTNPDVRFVIVGDGEERKNLEAQKKALELDDCVIFTGWQSDMHNIYSDLDTLVISSLNEGTPIPIIEALSAGCPVVATSVGGIPELLDDGALGKLVPPDDATALATAISETLANPPDTKLAQETMLRRYSIDSLAKEMDSLYRGLLAKKAIRR